MPKHKLFKIIIFTSGLLISSVSSSESSKTKLSPEKNPDLHRIETYLNEITSLRADFLQVSSNGTVSTGKLHMERPGKVRFEYDPPSPIMLISDGYYLRYIDRELEQITHIWLKNTPIGFLLKKNLKLSGDVTVTKFSKNANLLIATLTDSKKPEKGTLSLVFSDKPLTLRKWKIIDAQGITTTITLNNSERAIKIDPALFELNNLLKHK